jgi:purine catabolism regulator
VPLRSVASSVAQASVALDLALADGEATYRFGELPSTWLVRLHAGAAAVLAADILSPLAAEGSTSREEELIETARIFLTENGNWEAASRRLRVHRHTLRRRIRKIEELTSRDLGRIEDRVEFWLALRARDDGIQGIS